ncbi:MAG: PstS family phosphate ABC transporter substrate-binding protein [Nitriliruptoraceae bacterium]
MKSKHWTRIVALSSVLAIGLAACGGGETADTAQPATETNDSTSEGSTDAAGSELTGEIVIDGSSTVTPHTIPAAELFQEAEPGVQVAVATSGTGGGFEKFCNDETDISMASRRITDDEIAACEAAGVEWVEIGIANDGLAVAVNPDNDWVECITVDELTAIWQSGSDVTNWSQVNGAWPDQEIVLYGPGSDSGTFDYFTDAINGEEGNITANYNDIGEDDNAAIDGVASDVGAMNFVPLSFILESEGAVRPLEVENADGECVAPSEETVQDGSYNPLGRQLFIYPKASSLERPEVGAFIEFYFENQEMIAREALFIPLTDEQVSEARANVAAAIAG